MTGIPFCTIAGTWAWDSRWYRDGPWSQMMVREGFRHFKVNGQPFVWSTDANGHRFYRQWFGGSDFRDWEAAGYNLCDHLFDRLHPRDTHIFAHSHGLQPVLIAAALGLQIHTLTSIMSPPREDLWIHVNGQRVDVLEAARKRITYWQHLHSDRSDRWAVRGLFGDGRWGVRREHPSADLNYFVPRVGHSRILNEPELFEVWRPVLDTVRRYHGAV